MADVSQQEVTETGWGEVTHVSPLARPLEPLSQQVLAVTVQSGRVPVGASQLVGTVQELEALLVRGHCSVKCWVGVSHCHRAMIVRDAMATHSSAP